MIANVPKSARFFGLAIAIGTMDMHHNLKIHPAYFEAVSDGRKTFEVRKNDRTFQVYDTVQLREWNPTADGYTGRKIDCRITYVLSAFHGIEAGYIVFGITKIE
jgi:hypothetical protein